MALVWPNDFFINAEGPEQNGRYVPDDIVNVYC